MGEKLRHSALEMLSVRCYGAQKWGCSCTWKISRRRDDKGRRTMRSTSMESKEEDHFKEKQSYKSSADRGQEKVHSSFVSIYNYGPP